MTEPAFNGAGKSAGLELWRIENKAPVRQPVSGKFHIGDSYILLSTTVSKSGGFAWAIHFWLGSETSQDEMGIAAYKTVELDDLLGGAPVQYREVEGNESAAFLALFKTFGGIEYLPGGVESGFKKVDREAFDSRLLHIKGKRVVRVREVALSNRSLNTGDVFILDKGRQIYIWNGPTANKGEKAKGVEVATAIRNSERGGNADIILMDEEPNNQDFWGAIGGQINVTNPGEDDNATARTRSETPLYLISDASGEVQFTPVDLPGGKLSKDVLNGNDVYLLDAESKIFLWIGKGSSANERKESMHHAVNYIKSRGYPSNTAIERVPQGAETSVFKSEFGQWDTPKPFAFGTHVSTGVAKVSGEDQVNMEDLLRRKENEEKCVDDGSGKIEIWRVEDFKRVEVDPAMYGQFFGGDSYVILYTYLKNKVQEYIIYFWQGNESSADEKGSSALLAKELDDSLGDRPVQVRVVQGKEPAHFRQLFKGRMIVHKGGKASSFKNRSDSDSIDTDGVALFHVRGTNSLNTVAVQVAEVASNLNSGDCFVLVTPATCYVWKGSGCSQDEATVGLNVANCLAGNYNGHGGRSVVSFNEEAEEDDFWSALGGKAEYPTLKVGEPAPKDPRLFHCSTATGYFRVEEVVDFDQEDLNDEDVAILDCYTSVFVWVGSQSSDAEKAKSMEFASNYIRAAQDGRDKDIPIMKVNAGAEPVMFTAQFVGWDSSLAESKKFVDPYQAKMDALAKEKAAKAKAEEAKKPVVEVKQAAPVVATSSTVAPTQGGFFSYEDLVAGTPNGVNPTNKELYLSDADFSDKFGMSKAEFSAMPKWKQANKKKELGLF